ncbi:hypothetical protein BG000_005692, partial [Podila horticola]
MAVAENLTGHWAGRNTASNPRPVEYHCSVRIHQEQLNDAPPKYQEVYDENLRQRQHILDLQRKLRRVSIDRRGFKNDYFALLQKYNVLAPEYDKAVELRPRYDALMQEYHKAVKLRQHYNDLVDKYDKTVKKYDELDEKYLAIARTLQVTDDDQSTIIRKLTDMRSAIEDLVTKGKGQSSVNLNRVAAIQHFWDSELLQGFPVQEQDLEPFHLNLYIESVIVTILLNRLFMKPLQCIFDQGQEFEAICDWVERQGSQAAARWRQELCILIAKNSKEMADRKATVVSTVVAELKALVSRIYLNVDETDMFNRIQVLCNMAFDLSYAMFGMESRIYPDPIRL